MTTDSRHSFAIAPNLLNRNFKITGPDTVRLADISYIPTGEGWLYLAAVKDLATMEIVGWSMSERLKSTLCEDALKMAIRNRRPPPGLRPHGQGRPIRLRRLSQTAQTPRHHSLDEPQRELFDNAPMESFFSSLKTEMVHRTKFQTRREAKVALFEYIEIFHNRQRRHSSIGDRTPAQAGWT